MKESKPEKTKKPSLSFKKTDFSKKYVILFASVFAVIGAFLLVRTFAAPSVLTRVEGESMVRPTSAKVVQDANASLGQAVILNTPSSITGSFTVLNNVDSMDIRVRGSSCSQDPAKVRVRVDNTIVKTTSNVPSNSWRSISFDTTIAKGTHSLRIDGVNLGRVGSCVKTLTVDNATFYGEATVPTRPPAPSVTLSASPNTVDAGSSTNLTWSSTFASSCTASGAWSGTRATSGTASTGALNTTSTYTLTCSGEGGTANASAVVAVNSQPTPPPAPNPTPTPPPSSGGSVNCLVSNRTSWALAGTNCRVGTTITVTNQGWACSRALSSYATNGLPLRVISNSTVSWSGNAITLDNGCVGDGNNDTIDLIIAVNANGKSGGIGPQDDSSKFRQDPGPRDIQVTGKFECGMPGAGAHPDTWQFQSNSVANMAIVNGTTGDYAAGTSTCQTAGGAMFWSDSTKVDILGGEYIGCNHGINATQAGGSGSRVIDVKFRSGRTDGSDPNCAGYSASDPCIGLANLTYSNVTCQRWNSNTRTWQ